MTAAGTALDCNGNGIPDDCDLASGVSTDCNNNGILMSAMQTGGSSADCNGNGILDDCDLATGNPGCGCQLGTRPDTCEIWDPVLLAQRTELGPAEWRPDLGDWIR
ncbi:MAG: hypothetical protein R3F17_00550 [Planctomycetota bacterium]